MGEVRAESTEPSGLSREEARRRLRAHGENRMAVHDRLAAFREALGVLLDPMAIMLVGAASLYLVLGEWTDGVVMLVALVPVLGVDVFLEARSRQALRRLAERFAPQARVVREGTELLVPTAEVVPGDLLVLSEGGVIHADGVVRRCANLATDEASLTGESEPQSKGLESEFFAGSVVLTGHGLGEVTATGSETRYGAIARLVGAVVETQSPLQRRAAWLVKRLAGVALLVALGVAALGLARGQSWSEALLGGISLAMAAIPEEFPLVLTLFLSLGAWRLSRHGVLVRRLASVETLGATTVICTDKTGTLTRGEFAVDAWVPFGEVDERALIEAALFACEIEAADPMERALVAAAARAGVDRAALHGPWALLCDYDFDSHGKHMSHVWGAADGTRRLVAKGALEGILAHCSLSAGQQEEAERENARLAAKGMRVLAVAGRTGVGGVDRADDESELTLLGLVGFRDPLRPEVRAAILESQSAGVRIKLITGDHALTAHAIADEAGILHGDEGIVTGAALEALDDDARRVRIRAADIFARINPAQKHWIVDALQKDGHIVAMTGDGINDAPALRRSDIGISMGQRATEVARAAADMVLLDDDFTSIVAAIRQGRHIFRDIQRAFLYLLAFHVPIVGLALLAPLVGVPLLLLPIHLVWLELIVHPVSALLFQGDPPTADVMTQPPRNPSDPLLPRGPMLRSVLTGAVLTAAVFAIYLGLLPRGEDAARSVAFTTLLLGYQLLVLAERVALDPPGAPPRPRGLQFWGVWGLSGSSLPLAMYLPPLQHLLHLAPLGLVDWALAGAVAVAAVGWRFVLRLLLRG